MSHLVFYRKYRPKNLKTMFGQELVFTTFLNMVKLNRINHAYLFSGPRGTGKTSSAKLLAKLVNCEQLQDDVCDRCKSCHLSNTTMTTDIMEIDAASHNGVDEIREIIEKITYPTLDLKYRVIIIDEAHMLTSAAWNALLKTLEEPSDHVIFIFVTTEINKIMPTILSRCQHYHFKLLTNAQMAELINFVCQAEKLNLTSTVMHKIIHLAKGSARDCLTILEQVSLLQTDSVTPKLVNELFHLIDSQPKTEFLLALLQNDLPSIERQMEQLQHHGVDLATFLNELTELILEATFYLISHGSAELKELTVELIEQINLSVDELIFTADYLQQLLFKVQQQNHESYLHFKIGILNFHLCRQQFSVSAKPTNQSLFAATSVNPLIKMNEVEQQLKITELPSTANFPTEFFHCELLDLHEPVVNQPPDKLVINPVTSTVKNSVTPVTQSIDVETIFYEIMQTSDLDLRTELNNKLASLKPYHDNHLKFLANVQKFGVCSQFGVVLLFNDELACNTFNFALKKYQLIIKLETIFAFYGYWIGLTYAQAEKLYFKYQALKKTKTQFVSPPKLEKMLIEKKADPVQTFLNLKKIYGSS